MIPIVELIMNNHNTHLHSVENAYALESGFRRLVHNPNRILKKYIKQGMTILDLGCGTGYFTIEMARLLNGSGKVFALDVQTGMLDLLRQKLNNDELKEKICILNNSIQSIGINEKVDFILAFYSFHEMECLDEMIQSLKEIITDETKILISEQIGHVSKRAFENIINQMKENGFVVCERPRIFFSRSVVMKIANKNA